jgi:signal transduction histidine kinase
MAFFKTKHLPIGLAPRIALLSWLLTLVTLLLFVTLTIPQQKKNFLQNLESKANSVAVSLHDVAAGAAVNDDLASVVSASQTLLAGDPDLDFLIITKNDGFSLVNQQTGWSVEPDIDAYWLPEEREPYGEIATVPVLDRRIFHYAQPFDYSGIQWGWIHVGISLKDYDQSVASLYRNTIGLALACLVLSLLVSFFYSRQVVRPILRLRHLVQQIAGGDLTVQADIDRHDELGSLAKSVNTMSESLLRRDRILESVRFAAQQFLQTEQWEKVINDVLERLGHAADASRVCIFENKTDNCGRLCMSQRFEWTQRGITSQRGNPDLQMLPYDSADLDWWRTSLANNQVISGPVSEMRAGLRSMLETRGIQSLIVIPVFVGNNWWGFLCMDDCVDGRVWTAAEEDSLRAASDMFGATIARQGIQEALMDAKNTLEQRVEERTRELQIQVGAKEKALSDLADAQSSLLEVSRAAGMAEVATGVLHNVGNVLNSVNVSSALLIEQLRQSRSGNVAKVASLMQEHAGQLASFFSEDPRGRQIPDYLATLGVTLDDERKVMLRETESLRERIDHIKEIVSMQQSYGRVAGIDETIFPERLMEDALKLNAGALERHGVTVRREYHHSAPIVVDKHKILQILLNLINNAKYACSEVEGDKTITLRIDNPAVNRIRFQVVDNGIGILPENLIRVFQHGFTTRKSGHGFGLHSGALAARELGGNLSAHSNGLHTGATFTLELPCNPGERI